MFAKVNAVRLHLENGVNDRIPAPNTSCTTSSKDNVVDGSDSLRKRNVVERSPTSRNNNEVRINLGIDVDSNVQRENVNCLVYSESGYVKRLIECESPPKNIKDLTSIRAMEYDEFLLALKSSEVDEVCVLTELVEQSSPSTIDTAKDSDTKKCRYESQGWDKIKESSAFYNLLCVIGQEPTTLTHTVNA